MELDKLTTDAKLARILAEAMDQTMYQSLQRAGWPVLPFYQMD